MVKKYKTLKTRRFSSGASVLAAEQLQKGLKLWWAANPSRVLLMTQKHQVLMAQIENKLNLIALSPKSVHTQFRFDHALTLVKQAAKSPAEAEAILHGLENRPEFGQKYPTHVKLVEAVLPPGQTQATLEQFIRTVYSIGGIELNETMAYGASDAAASIINNAHTIGISFGIVSISTFTLFGCVRHSSRTTIGCGSYTMGF